MKKIIAFLAAIVIVTVLLQVVSAQEARFTGTVVTVADNPSRPLAALVKSEVDKLVGGDNNVVWAGYQLTVRPSMRRALINWTYNEKGHHVHITSGHYESSVDGIERVYSDSKNLLFKFTSGSTTHPQSVMMYDSDEQYKTSRPVVWITGVTSSRSLSMVKSFIDSAPGEEARSMLMGVIAAHPGREPQDYLVNKVRSGESMKVRKQGLFWYGQTLDGEELGELPAFETEFKDIELRKHLVFVYHDLESKAGLQRLVHIAKTDQDEEVVEQAIFWIGQTDGVDTVDLLKDLYDKSKSVRIKEKVIFSLSQTEDERALDVLSDIATGDPDENIREKAIFWIGQHDDEQVALQKLKDIYSGNLPKGVRKKLVFSASQIDISESLDFLADVAMKDDDLGLRREAAFWIGQHDDESEALSFLKRIYGQETDQQTKEKIIFSVSQIETDDAARFLLELAKTEQNKELRQKALFWLTQTESDVAVDYIETVLDK